MRYTKSQSTSTCVGRLDAVQRQTCRYDGRFDAILNKVLIYCDPQLERGSRPSDSYRVPYGVHASLSELHASLSELHAPILLLPYGSSIIHVLLPRATCTALVQLDPFVKIGMTQFPGSSSFFLLPLGTCRREHAFARHR